MEVFMLASEKTGSPRRNRRRQRVTVAAVALLAVGCLGFFSTRALAAPSFQEAAALYNAGKYPQALSMLQTIEPSFPNNPWVHYYMALSHQAMGHIEQAKAQYQIVVNSRDPKLCGQAATGLSQLSGVRTSGGGGSSASTAAASSGGGSGGGGGGQKLAMGKVKKVLDFWAVW
jgi:uncharacterized membrane protein YgcG